MQTTVLARSAAGSAVESAYGRPLLEVAREIGRHLATMHRWRVNGVLDSRGDRRRLPMTRVGGRWHVRESDMAEFFAILAGPEDAPRQSGEDARATERAARELDSIGI